MVISISLICLTGEMFVFVQSTDNETMNQQQFYCSSFEMEIQFKIQILYNEKIFLIKIDFIFTSHRSFFALNILRLKLYNALPS